MNILIAINEKYIEPAKTMLYSLACQQEEVLDIYLLQSSIHPPKLEELQEFVRCKCHGTLNVVNIDETLFANVPTAKWWSQETYYRLVAFALLPKNVERILWLDADIVVKGNLSEFFEQDFDGKYIIACSEDTTKNHARLGLSHDHRYFNAGVILYNLDAIRRNFTVQDIFNCIEKHRDHLDALDQDVLNLLFEHQVKYADARIYNNETLGFHILPKGKMDELRDTARVIHYIGAMKPWNYRGANWADRYWWKYEIKRGGRIAAALKYRVLHAPVKLWHYLREGFYMVQGQLRKIGKHS